MKPYNLLGLGVQSGFPTCTAQERVNCYLEQRQDGEQISMAAIGTPGLTLFSNLGVNVVRGLYSSENYAYAVAGNAFYRIDNAGTASIVGTIGSSSGNVYMSSNGTQIFIADNTPNAYYYTIASNTLAASNSPQLVSSSFLDGYIIGNEYNTGRYYISGLYDASTWNPSEYATAESNPDNLSRVFTDQGGCILFGLFTTEIVGNTGAADFPFGRVGYPIEWGLYATDSVAKVGDGVAFLARNRLGQAQVVIMNGYTPQRISTHDIERLLNDSSTLEAASGFSYMTNGHIIYQLNAGGKTYLYDVASGAWSFGKSQGLTRSISDKSVNLINRTLVSHYSSGRIFVLGDDVYDEAGDPLVMSITGTHIFGAGDEVSLAELFVDCETGVGASTGQGVDPQMMLQISRDGGHTWGTEHWRDMGSIGDYSTRCTWFRMGRGYRLTVKVAISDPVKRCIIGAYARVA